MANGPGLSWGAGVASSGQSEGTDATKPLLAARSEAGVRDTGNGPCIRATEAPSDAPAHYGEVRSCDPHSLSASRFASLKNHSLKNIDKGTERASLVMSINKDDAVGQAVSPVAAATPAAATSMASGSGGGGGGNGNGNSNSRTGANRGSAGGGSAAPGAPPLSLEPNSSLVEQVSREVIRKLRLAASAGSAEDRHVVCEELFADITCPLDASALAALLGPVQPCRKAGTAAAGATMATRGTAEPSAGALGGDGGDRSRAGRGRLYYEVLAVHYATRGAADSARALLHLCQLLWDAPWVAPIYALLLHRFLLLPRDVGGSGGGHSASTSALPGTAATSAADAGRVSVPYASTSSYADQRVKHLNVLAHGTRQLLLGDVHSGLSRFQPLWAFLGLEVACLGPRQPQTQPPLAGTSSLPPVASIDAVPAAARPWLLAVTAAFLPYYCLDEQVSEMARRFPPPVPVEGPPPPPMGTLTIGGGGNGASGGVTAAAAAGFDFLVVEVTDVLGRINSEAGLLKYLWALRALARQPARAEHEPYSSPQPPEGAKLPTGGGVATSGDERAREGGDDDGDSGGGGGGGDDDDGRRVGSKSSWWQRDAQRGAALSRRTPPPPQQQPLAGLPTITKLRLQNELYALTSGGGPRYAPPEVRKAAFAALDALFPGGRSLRRLVRWASRTLHLEWLEGESSADDPWVGSSGWLSWVYWPVHWWTALYGRALLAAFQLLYGIVVWRPFSRADAVGGPSGVARGTMATAPAGWRVAASSDGASPGVHSASAGGNSKSSGGGFSGFGGRAVEAVADRGRTAWWQPALRLRRAEQQQQQQQQQHW